MKTSRVHRVPLSGRAIAILDQARVLANNGSPWMFSGRGGAALSRVAPLDAVRTVDGTKATPHGMRSAFRDWCSEQADAALAHASLEFSPDSRPNSPIGNEMRFERPVTSVQPPVQHQCDLEFSLLPQRAFPDDRHSPSGFEQIVPVAPVPAHVGMELCLPEFLAGGRVGGVRASDVTVPEAAVNEAHGSESTKHEIGGTRELAVVQAVSKIACVESPAKSDFGYSVPASNPRHHA